MRVALKNQAILNTVFSITLGKLIAKKELFTMIDWSG
jgi:hypothetical protein